MYVKAKMLFSVYNTRVGKPNIPTLTPDPKRIRNNILYYTRHSFESVTKTTFTRYFSPNISARKTISGQYRARPDVSFDDILPENRVRRYMFIIYYGTVPIVRGTDVQKESPTGFEKPPKISEFDDGGGGRFRFSRFFHSIRPILSPDHLIFWCITFSPLLSKTRVV